MYSNILEINKNFQTSVNIDYDLGNSKKIREYIPTSDVCDVLKMYFKSLLRIEKNNATILVGPYGKGKSFLILVLLQIICFKRNEDVNYLLDKIKIVDKELFDLIEIYTKQKKKFLPIVVDSNYYNIEQSFLLSLNESLKAAGLDDVVPNTIYGVCLDLLNKWEKDKENKSKLEICAKKFKVSISELKQQLEHFDITGYKNFENIYNCLTTGLNFNPMMNSDIVKIFSDVNNQIYKRGYDGMFIIYDEFNKTLEAKNEFLSKDLKLIQDFAEKANRSAKEEQLHLCCITHKSLALYQDKKNGSSLDSFKTVEGRFKEIRFNRSLDQNYQIISLSIGKKAKYQQTVKNFCKTNTEYIKKLNGTELFEDIDTKELLEGCFPFNPIAAYSLIQLSELVAQNERTMFTLISDNDENSFSSFVTNNSDGLYNIDKLYDYFNKSFSSDDGEIKSIWHRCESSLSEVKKSIDNRILKALACIRMINDFAKLPPTSTAISLALFEPLDEIEKEIELLTTKRIIKRGFGDKLDFTTSSAKEIDVIVDNYIAQKRSYKKDVEVLEQVYKNKFYLPRRYNAENKITRYFRIAFITDKELMALNSFELLLNQSFCDGIVAKVIKSSLSKKKIKDRFLQIENNKNVILQISTNGEDEIIEEARRIDALFNIKESKEFDEATKEQMARIYKEKQKDFSNTLDMFFSINNSYVVDLYNSQNVFDAIENVCKNMFASCPIVNNEMINKEVITTAYKKPRDTIIELILERCNPYEKFSKTSPEITVYNSFYNDYNELNDFTKEITNSIKSKLQSKPDKNIKFSDVINPLKQSPYGIRTGILPVYLAIALSNMSDNTILYFDKAEIPISAINIDKLAHSPEKYSLLVEKKTKEQEKYLENIIKSFNSVPTDSYYANLRLACSLIEKWFVNLPIVLKEIAKEDNFLKLKDEFYDVREMFLKYNSINDYEIIIKKMPSLFDGDFDKTVKFISSRDDNYKKIEDYAVTLANKVKSIFYKGYKGSLNGCIKEWKANDKIDFANCIFESTDQNIANIIKTLNYNDDEALNQLSSAIIKYRIDDWATNNTDTIINAIKEFKTNVENSKEGVINKETHKVKIKNMEISSMGKMFENNIESVLDEFNDSISNEEKAYILMKIIKKFSGE